MSNSANIGWLFYRDYFEGLDYSDLKNKFNEKRINTKVQNIIDQTPEIREGVVLGNNHLKATTTYPGLLLGSGNTHELPSIEGQAILGFHFDYTSGLPVIPGSSIKGVLRSAFKHKDYIYEILEDDEIDVEALEEEIFNNGDIFFDAEIISGSRILGDDYLTPHGDGIKEPIPLRFIKVLPGVTFRFDFELKKGLLKAKQKIDLFSTILQDLGLGAKTNVGYGKFDTFSVYQTEEERLLASAQEEKEAFDKIMDSASKSLKERLDDIETFKVKYSRSRFLEEVEIKMDEIKLLLKRETVAQAYTNLRKDNKKHVESFIEKNKKFDYAQEWVVLAESLLKKNEPDTESEKNKDISVLDAEFKDVKAFKTALYNLDKSLLLSPEGQEVIETNCIRIYKEQKGKAKKKFFAFIQLTKLIDEAFDRKVQSAT